MKNKGKSYFTRTPHDKRDLYHTPFSLTWKLAEVEKFNNIIEPACGNNAIVKAGIQKGLNFSMYYDIDSGEDDFLNQGTYCGDMITNPPFYLWDEFVMHALDVITGKIAVIGRTNYLGCVNRSKSGMWNYLQRLYIFNRYVDYRTPYREDGLFHVGGMCSGWFIFENIKTNNFYTYVLNVNEYAKLGAFKEVNNV